MADHHPLGLAGGARGIGQQRQVVDAACGNLVLEALGVAPVLLAAGCAECVERMQQVVPVRPHPGVVPVRDAAQGRELVRDGQGLVHLLLVLREDEAGAGVLAQVEQFVGGRVGVHADRAHAERLRGEERPEVFGLVFADDHGGVAAPHPQRRSTQRNGAHLVQDIGPGVAAPDALALDALRQLLRASARMIEPHLRQSLRFAACPPSRADTRRGGACRQLQCDRVHVHAAAPR